jgi:uncharacterized integral membrane protein (TIGR00697 family)
MKDKSKFITPLQAWLTVLFVSALLVSNIITYRQVLLPGGIVITGGAIVFPITYILSDLFSEVYGYKWSRITCYMGFAMNIFMVACITLIINAPAPDFFDGQQAFVDVLGNTPRVLIASLCAFVVGDLVNDVVFAKMKEKHPDSIKGFGWRAIVSSLIGEIVDSSIFLPISLLGVLPVNELLILLVTEVLIKTSYEVLILPVTTLIVKKVGEAENGSRDLGTEV